MVPTNYYLILSAILFGLGAVAFVFKRNIITIFMSIDLMLNAVNLAFVAFSQAFGKVEGQVFVLFVIVVAAAEAAVGLGIIILIQRNRQSLNIETVNLLKLQYLRPYSTSFHSFLYCAAYTSDECGYYRFCYYLNRLMLFMLFLVLAANYVLLSV